MSYEETYQQPFPLPNFLNLGAQKEGREAGSAYAKATSQLSSRDMRRYILKGPAHNTLRESAQYFFPDFEFRPVETVEELKSSSALVYQEYLKSGFISPRKNNWKLSLFQTIPTTVTFVAIYRKEHVLGTVTLVEDSPLGLPMDNLYHEELISLRLEGHRIMEYTMLAMNKEIMNDGPLSLPPSVRRLLVLHLLWAVVDYLRTSTKIDCQVACFHPKHDGFYKFLSMLPLGNVRYHGGVKGKPALARYHNLRHVEAEGDTNMTYRLSYKSLPRKEEFKNKLVFSKEDLKTLFVEHSNILASADAEKLAYIQSHYPKFDLNEIVRGRNILSYLIDSLESQVFAKCA